MSGREILENESSRGINLSHGDLGDRFILLSFILFALQPSSMNFMRFLSTSQVLMQCIAAPNLTESSLTIHLRVREDSGGRYLLRW